MKEDAPDPVLLRYKLVGEDKLLAKAAIFRKAPEAEPITYWPIVVPTTMIPAVLSVFHGDTSALGHGGKHKTYGAMKTRFIWKGLVSSLRQWLGACHKCLRRKRVVPQHQRYNVHVVQRAPMNRITMDIVGPL